MLKEIYLVIDDGVDEPILGAFTSIPLAEEFINKMLDEVMPIIIETTNPVDTFGEHEWTDELIEQYKKEILADCRIERVPLYNS